MLKLTNENNPAFREPRPSKRKSNGFTEPPEDAAKLLVFQTGKRKSGEEEVLAVSDQALHRHRQAMYILTQKDRPIPRWVATYFSALFVTERSIGCA